MRIEIFRKNVELTQKEESFVREKIEHLGKYSLKLEDESILVKVEIFRNKVKSTDDKIVVEITIDVPHSIIRAEEAGAILEEALNKACDRLKRQIEKYKNSHDYRTKEGEWLGKSTLDELNVKQDEFKEVMKIVKRKKLEKIDYITEEEAINNLDLLGHDFYLYRDKSDQKLRVVYRRKDGTLGSIEAGD